MALLVPLEDTLPEDIRKFPTLLIIDPINDKVILTTNSYEIKNINEFKTFLDEVIAY